MASKRSASGRSSQSWSWKDPGRKVKVFAGVLITDRSQKRVLLGKKKRGFGTDLWQHSFCGKVEHFDEDLADTARRELQEESGLVLVQKSDLRPLGLFRYEFTEAKDLPYNMEVHIFTCDLGCTRGSSVQDTPEIRPEWHHFDQVPYSLMWPDNRFWLPYFLEHCERASLTSAYFLYESLTSVKEHYLEWQD